MQQAGWRVEPPLRDDGSRLRRFAERNHCPLGRTVTLARPPTARATRSGSGAPAVSDEILRIRFQTTGRDDAPTPVAVGAGAVAQCMERAVLVIIAAAAPTRRKERSDWLPRRVMVVRRAGTKATSLGAANPNAGYRERATGDRRQLEFFRRRVSRTCTVAQRLFERTRSSRRASRHAPPSPRRGCPLRQASVRKSFPLAGVDCRGALGAVDAGGTGLRDGGGVPTHWSYR
jgi:hypothetical protein